MMYSGENKKDDILREREERSSGRKKKEVLREDKKQTNKQTSVYSTLTRSPVHTARRKKDRTCTQVRKRNMMYPRPIHSSRSILPGERKMIYCSEKKKDNVPQAYPQLQVHTARRKKDRTCTQVRKRNMMYPRPIHSSRSTLPGERKMIYCSEKKKDNVPQAYPQLQVHTARIETDDVLQ